jgi:hypothetical protein
MLNIMIVKQKAAPAARRGTRRVERVSRRRLAAAYQTGSIAAPATREVRGLTAESGMCIFDEPLPARPVRERLYRTRIYNSARRNRRERALLTPEAQGRDLSQPDLRIADVPVLEPGRFPDGLAPGSPR